MNKRTAHRRNFYLTTHNIHTRLTSMSPAGFEPTFPANEWPHSHYSDSTFTGIGHSSFRHYKIRFIGRIIKYTHKKNKW